MKNTFKVLTILSLFLNTACEKNKPIDETDFRKQIEELWESYTKKFPENHIKSAYFAVYYPNKNIEDSIVFAYGESMPGVQANTNDQLYLASVGKMLCATVVLQLMEEGKLSLDDKITNYLPAKIMDGLHVFEGTEYSNDITIKHLLEHSSGVPDFIFDKTNGSDLFIDLVIASNLDSVWTPEVTIEFSKKYQVPFCKPGKDHYYSDTGYNLLGLIIEAVTGGSLAEVYRERIFTKYGLTQSFMPYYENPVENTGGGIWANTYFYDNKTGINHGEVDHPNVFSFEFGGGNWVATLSDIHTFMEKLVDCKVFNDCEIRDQMFTERWPASALLVKDIWYGYGIGIEDGSHGYLYGHEGANNAKVIYAPRYDAYYIIVLNQINTSSVFNVSMLPDVLNLLKKFTNPD
jgi:CubicO group peptidase (beta-lactamase class C family)